MKMWCVLVLCCALCLTAWSEPAVKIEHISLNFKSVDVRAVLASITDVSGVNMVVSEGVKGTVTVRLQDMPWNQALEVILLSQGLAKREMNHVWYIAPATEIAALEKATLAARAEGAVLAPVKSEFIPIKYANAADLMGIIQSPNNNFLSPRGKISVDKRTNTLLVQDTVSQLHQIHRLMNQLDVPVKQVSIAARIVVADRQAREELGVAIKNINSKSLGRYADVTNTRVNTPIHDPAGTLGLSVGALPNGFALDVELQALESKGKSKTISAPQLTVANNQEAVIEQGQDVPYQTSTSSGATQIEFKKAVLGLKVTPQITPDGKVVMHLEVSDDHLSKDKGTAGDVPIVATSRISTSVLVNDRQTLVLGGVLKENQDHSVTGIPFLGQLPGVGFLFRSTSDEHENSELMIFITPTIVEGS